jgi:mannose-6-phosphate isomerase-like protein (cupin superfamily)
MAGDAMEKVNLFDKFASFQDHWSPKIAAEVNDHAVKLVKLQGEFLWHHHEKEDELFFVVRGRLTIRFRDRDVVLEPNELLVVPRGVEHMPVAEEETWILLVEPAGTLNTGNVESDRTVGKLQKI